MSNSAENVSGRFIQFQEKIYEPRSCKQSCRIVIGKTKVTKISNRAIIYVTEITNKMH
jgi:hypothetical protein